MKPIKLMILLVGAVAVCASTASAASLLPSGAVNFTGTNVGKHEFLLQASGVVRVECATVTFTGSKAASASVVTFVPTYTGCSINSPTSRPSSVNQWPAACSWALFVAGAAFNSGTGALTGATVSTCNSTVVTIPSIPTCRITIAGQSLAAGITGQNRTAGDAGNAPASGAAAGSRLIATAAPANYTAFACPGVSSGVGSYTGTVYTPGLWFGP